MKLLVAFFFFAVSASLSAQTPLQTFTDPDGMFQFKHSSVLVRCTEQTHEEGQASQWAPENACVAYIPVCADPGTEGSRTLVCYAYSKTGFENYPEFSAAAFSVAEIKGVVTEKECLGGSPDWANITHGKPKTVNINRVKFKMFETPEVGLGNGLDGTRYRNFHRNRCYELSVRVASVNRGVLGEPINEFTQKDWQDVDERLQQALRSFRFLK
jgi:hypothetical protein